METESDKPAPLIFEWDKPRSVGPGLFVWLLVSMLGLGLFFYLFKVVYPQTQRVTPVPQQVFMLNSALPSNQALINRVRDLDYLVLSGSDDTMKEVKLEDRVPVFHPTFEKHELQLQDLPHKDYATAPPRLLNIREPVLRPPDLSELKKKDSQMGKIAANAELKLQFDGPVANLNLVQPSNFTSLQLSDPDAWRYQIGVEKSSGRVAFVLPVNAGEQPKVGQEILKRLQELRFEPQLNTDSTESVIWSSVTFSWGTP